MPHSAPVRWAARGQCLSKCCPKARNRTKVVAILRIFYACWSWRQRWSHRQRWQRRRRRQQRQRCRKRKTEWMGGGCLLWSGQTGPGQAGLKSLRWFRVLFSLHFSCITSMAIVHVNFDVSAKVVKCEVLDVLIALCRAAAARPAWPRGGQRWCQSQHERGRASESESSWNYRLDRWRMPKTFQVTLLLARFGWPAWRVGHSKINSSLFRWKAQQNWRREKSTRQTRPSWPGQQPKSASSRCLISYLFCLHVSFEFSVLIEWEVRWACSFPCTHVVREGERESVPIPIIICCCV